MIAGRGQSTSYCVGCMKLLIQQKNYVMGFLRMYFKLHAMIHFMSSGKQLQNR